MHVGLFTYNVDYGARPDDLARAAEERGFESLWVGEHTHIPAGRQTPYPGGDPLPKPYYHMADPFVSLMAAASATRSLPVACAIDVVRRTGFAHQFQRGLAVLYPHRPPRRRPGPSWGTVPT